MRIRLTSLMATMFWLQDTQNQVMAANDLLSGHIDTYGAVSLNTPVTLNVTLNSPKKSAHVYMLLCQGVAPESSTSTTVYKIQSFQDLCVVSDPTQKCSENLAALIVQGNQPTPIQFTITSQTVSDHLLHREIDQAMSNSLNNFFVCVSSYTGSCHIYSQLFSLGGVGNSANFVPPTTDISVQNLPPTTSVQFSAASILTVATGFPSTTIAANPGGGLPSTSTSFSVTTTMPPTGTTTIPQSPETASSAAVSGASTKSSSGGLSVGAKAGIAVGALGVLFLLLLAALFFLRRAHQRKRAHNSEQVMLNRSIANDSRDLMAEKEAEHTSPSSFDAPVPVFAGEMGTGERPGSGGRHSALSPYEQIPSQPYSGTAAAIPRRKAATGIQSNTQSRGLDSIPASEPLSGSGLVSRGVSNASTNIISPRSPGAPSSSDPSDRSHEFEEYHDVPVYGDARHVPQVFNGGLQAPFLADGSGDSLSSAEAARLAEEEEERRIDAAIAEAERAKGGGI
ncbi:hypothetical protein BGZ60DRAFT_130638 [Tricladium varicosporioides]|nr:hypothetical protein BGZ60DRAFT_130638 [Hymenoscyphus varicosporioides]